MAKHQKVAVVAGGSAGVGRAVVSRLIEEGYVVGVLARGRERLDELEEFYGEKVYCLVCDVADASAVARAGATIEEVFGPVEVWVNSAMLTSFSPFMSMDTEEFEQIVDATLLGVVNGTRTALSLMERRNRGRIVTAGSGLAYRSVPYQSAYCAAKHGVNGFMASVRSELIREGSEITVGLVQLPALDTPQFGCAQPPQQAAATRSTGLQPRRRGACDHAGCLRGRAGIFRRPLGPSARVRQHGAARLDGQENGRQRCRIAEI